MFALTWRKVFGLSLTLVLFAQLACEQNESKSSAASEGEVNKASADGQASENPDNIAAIEREIDWPTMYCQNLKGHNFLDDFREQLALFCQDDAPTELTYKMMNLARDKTDNPPVVRLTLEHGVTDYSKMTFAWAVQVPIEPFYVKSRPLWEYLENTSPEGPYQTSIRMTKENETEEGLHLVSVDMEYDIKIVTPNGGIIHTNKSTEFNLFQILSGSDEMGIVVENFKKDESLNYNASKMLILSFPDEDGGAFIINLQDIDVNTSGFRELSTQGFEDIVQASAIALRDGLSSEKYK